MANGDMEKLFMGWINDPSVGEKLVQGKFDEALKQLDIPATDEVKEALKNLNYENFRTLCEALNSNAAS